ncbi:MAG: penicillin-binding protein 1C [Bdellovibrionales bacterium]|nr:penicillin-binding protein 1C [Bdellovibrionales bacterium]
MALVFLGVLHRGLVAWQPFGPLLKDHKFSQVVYDREGRLLRFTLNPGEQYQLPVLLSHVSPFLVESTLLYEDRHFFRHFGVNPYALARAFWSTYVEGSRKMGASTLTMQLVRQLYGISTHTISGKLRQIYEALKIEYLYSKKDILAAYFTVAPYGYNILGVEAASLIYFNKPSQRLSLQEAMTLAVLPQNPTDRVLSIARQGTSGGELQRARRRLFEMWKAHHSDNLTSESDVDLALTIRSPRELPFKAPHFTRRMLLQNPQASFISSSLNSELQELLQKSIDVFLQQREKEGIDNAVTLLINTETLEVLSYIGSADFFRDEISGQVDGVQARRSPGSALKPFVYGLALDQGHINPLTVLKDAPTEYEGTYTPDNFDREYVGPISATDALIHSRNVPAIQLAKEIQEPDLYDFLKAARVPLTEERQYYGLSLALGTAEVTMEELLSMYALFYNSGKYKELKWSRGEGFEKGTPLLSPEASFLTYKMLEQNPSPTLKGFEQLDQKLNVAWKTGTSTGFRDAWSIGLVGHYALAVWIGDFSGKGNPAFVGREVAGVLLFQMLDALKAYGLKGLYQTQAPIAEMNLSEVEVCPASGHIAGPDCPHRRKTWFIPGKTSIGQCLVHRKIPMLISSGLRSCPSLTEPTVSQVFEFWSSDMLLLFQKAGIGRRTPPAFDPRCLKVSYGRAPRIVSPKKEAIYTTRSKGTGTKTLPLLATVDADVKRINWYIDGSFFGTFTPQETPEWRALSGVHQVRVVDDQGRSESLSIQVRQVD